MVDEDVFFFSCSHVFKIVLAVESHIQLIFAGLITAGQWKSHFPRCLPVERWIPAASGRLPHTLACCRRWLPAASGLPATYASSQSWFPAAACCACLPHTPWKQVRRRLPATSGRLPHTPHHPSWFPAVAALLQRMPTTCSGGSHTHLLLLLASASSHCVGAPSLLLCCRHTPSTVVSCHRCSHCAWSGG